MSLFRKHKLIKKDTIYKPGTKVCIKCTIDESITGKNGTVYHVACGLQGFLVEPYKIVTGLESFSDEELIAELNRRKGEV